MSYLCSICGDSDHTASRCKELAPPPDGFYKPAPGTTHNEDGDEDTISSGYNIQKQQKQQKQQTHHKNYKNKIIEINISKVQYSYKLWYQRVLKAKRTKKLS
jgi:hypothetical protein